VEYDLVDRAATRREVREPGSGRAGGLGCSWTLAGPGWGGGAGLGRLLGVAACAGPECGVLSNYKAKGSDGRGRGGRPVRPTRWLWL